MSRAINACESRGFEQGISAWIGNDLLGARTTKNLAKLKQFTYTSVWRVSVDPLLLPASGRGCRGEFTRPIQYTGFLLTVQKKSLIAMEKDSWTFLWARLYFSRISSRM